MKAVVNTLRVAAVCLAVPAGYLTHYEFTTYELGTSRDIEVSVIAEPFAGGPDLVYRWHGHVWRGCDITIRRKFIDSEGVETELVALSFDALPASEFGETSYEVRVPVPRGIPEGRAVYQATEVPHCTLWQRWFPVGFDYPPVEFTVTR